MSEPSLNLFRLSVAQLVDTLQKCGFTTANEDYVNEEIRDGFSVNQDGTIDLFDFVTWIIGKPQQKEIPRTPPSEVFNLQSVNPTELAGWLTLYNHIGYEVPEGRIIKLKQKFGSRINASDKASNISFTKFIGVACLHRPKQVTARSKDEAYLRHKEEMNRRNKEASAISRDIGQIPEVVNPEQKEDCRYDFKLFCMTYFKNTFELKFCEDQEKCIKKIENAVLNGGLFALALPRGSGKTTLCEVATIWSMIYGHCQFVVLVGASETAALEMMDSIKTEIETNESLSEDFPEVCYPIAALEGIAHRCNGQTCNGERTRISWTADELVLPTIKDSDASGVVVRVAGITGRIRGMKYKRPDGKTIRPSLVIVDDPQTRESACSLEQNKKRIQTLSGDILGLAGPGKKIAGIMPCTVIQPGDMADTILDKEKHPDWNGEKCKLLKQFPKNMQLWEQYGEIRADSLRDYGNIERATEFYIEHRAEMDDGAIVEWEERHLDDEVSALQNAMNLYFRDPVAFSAEYQNEPLNEDISDDTTLTADYIAGKVNGLPKETIPLDCSKITMFIDVQKNLLFYTVAAWADDFTGSVVEYGTWPAQRMRRFTLSTANPTLQTEYPHKSVEGQIYAGLEDLCGIMMGKVYTREDGLQMAIDKAAVDANWGQSTDVVYQYCRQSGFVGRLLPSHGHYVGAASKPMSEYHRQPGDKVGLNWRMPSVKGKRAIRYIIYDTNFWKTFVNSRLALDKTEKGSLSLFGNSPFTHELFSEHLTAEFRVKTTGRGRTVDEWRLRPDTHDNHWLDCTVGCAVLASVCGSALPEQLQATPQKKRMSLSDIASGRMSPTPQLIDTTPKATVKQPMKLSDMIRHR